MTLKEKSEEMRLIQEEILHLTSSPLYEYRVSNNYLPVIGEGSYNASVVFIGEAPGKNEAINGKPFCGSAGKILDQLLESISLNRKDVYITNIVKDRPPKNRDPLPEEIDSYGPFLDREIEIIQPKVIVTLGRYAMQFAMKKFNIESERTPIGQAHGKSCSAHTAYGAIHIIPQYHPAATIYNRSLIDVLHTDFQIIKSFI